jgi:dihydroorotase
VGDSRLSRNGRASTPDHSLRGHPVSNRASHKGAILLSNNRFFSEDGVGSLLIKGGRVISPGEGLDEELDVLVEDGAIREIAPQLTAAAAELIDARGQVVSPGFVDIHVHLREPGGEASETFETGLAAAVAGGFTAVCSMPNTKPVIDAPERVRAQIEKAQRLGLARVFPVAAVSMASQGESVTDMAALVAAGAVAFSDDGRPVKTAGLLKRALEKTRELGVPLSDHCEDPSLSSGGFINEGPVSQKLRVRGNPASSEDVAVARDLLVAEAAGAHLHVAHLSTARALEMVRQAKRRGVRITCEVTPHHFTLTDEAVLEYGTNAKMNPPLRSAQDVEAICEGIADGTVDAIATDHAPHAPELKAKPLTGEAPFGIIGLETSLALALRQLVHRGKISLSQLVSLMSFHPARIINQPLGRLIKGAAADLTLFDPSLEWTYQASAGRSKSRNSPFDGWKFTGGVTTTIVAGKVVYRRA